jgi:hypothetical protein
MEPHVWIERWWWCRLIHNSYQCVFLYFNSYFNKCLASVTKYCVEAKHLFIHLYWGHKVTFHLFLIIISSKSSSSKNVWSLFFSSKNFSQIWYIYSQRNYFCGQSGLMELDKKTIGCYELCAMDFMLWIVCLFIYIVAYEAEHQKLLSHNMGQLRWHSFYHKNLSR